MAQQLLGASSGSGTVLDPRTKLLLTLTVCLVVMGGTAQGWVALLRPLVVAVPFVLFCLAHRPGNAIAYGLLYFVAFLAETYLLPQTKGLLAFILIAFCGIFMRFLPCLMTGAYLVSTTTVSQFMAAMERMHVSPKITIPLSVMFRFFPTVWEECGAVNRAMKMRGVTLGNGNLVAMLEYRLVPMMSCSVKIGDDLGAAALTRGLGSPIRRTNVCTIGFHRADIVAIAFCLVVLAAYGGWFVHGLLA